MHTSWDFGVNDCFCGMAMISEWISDPGILFLVLECVLVAAWKVHHVLFASYVTWSKKFWRFEYPAIINDLPMSL